MPGVSLEPLLQRIADAARQRGCRPELEIVDRVATRNDAGLLERVIGHIVQNALDATSADGHVWVTLRQMSNRVALLVGNMVSGTEPEFIRNRLFRPFNSTKTCGMGIGSYKSFQFIRGLGSSIDVACEIGHGTKVTILLPLFDLRTTSDLRPVEAK